MSASTPPSHPTLADQLPANVYHYLIRTLCLTLPPPPTDSPEDLACRNDFAIARIAALSPANAAEADQAALYVAASEQWKECLRIAHEPDTSPNGAMKCRAQVNSMMRQAQGALRMLFRMQATRQKQEANTEPRNNAARTRHHTIDLMTQALSPQPQPTQVAAPPSPSAPAQKPQQQRAPAQHPQPARLVTARQDTAITTQTAVLIRLRETLNNLPHDDFGSLTKAASPCGRGAGEGASPARHHAANSPQPAN